MSDLTFTVPGIPVAKGRPRIGKNFQTGKPRNVTPEETVRFESRAKHEAWLAMHALRRELLKGAVAVEIDAYWVARADSRAESDEPKTTKPDGSNVAKAVEDAMNAVVYVDDARIVDLHVRKWWARPGAAARTFVRVVSLDGEWP